MEQEKKYTVCEANVWGLCQEYQRRGEVPQITVIRSQFDKPHSLHIQRHWSEWMRENRAWVASKKGAKYGYKRLYEESKMEIDKLSKDLESCHEAIVGITQYLEDRYPGIASEMMSNGTL